MIGFADAKIVKEDLVEFVIIVLARMHEHMVAMLVEASQHARQPDDLGPRTDDTREAPHFYAAITQVREALRGKPVASTGSVVADIERAQGAL